MDKELEGYVIYCKDLNKEIPLGVVSNNYDCQAISKYIPSRLKNFLVEIEDKRFYDHKGVDIRGVSRAIFENLKEGKIVQGGSTISQQLARNIIRDNKKNFKRKFRETYKAFQIEKLFSKNEILDLYFNNIYFGKNIWGLRTAGLYYFNKEVDKLSQSELIYLLTILRGPNYYTKNSKIFSKRYNLINGILFEKKLISKSRYQKNIKSKLTISETPLSNFNEHSINFITKYVDDKRKKIISTIDLKTQKLAQEFVKESKYPVSIIALKKGKVIGFASSYGTDYPFISKSNVGSTLKPFIYCNLRENGVLKTEKFDSFKNTLDWKVREVKYYKPQLTIKEALLYSNNNAFLNATGKVGIDSNLEFLSNILDKPKSDFFPSSILGATRNGISLYDLALAYSTFFNPDSLTENKTECLSILNEIFYSKLGLRVDNAFLKTGTTNENKERYAILGNADLVYAVLRNENKINDSSKEGSFMKQISRKVLSMFQNNKNFVWI
ncbi:MAG: transglycosylase domain-containing protein [Zunongwangia sp.]|uniref:transglycosylase domain-containing protein n=1 Tax=Zunongwangia sp. TaxID=1965325 RepID=UPI003241FAD9